MLASFKSSQGKTPEERKNSKRLYGANVLLNTLPVPKPGPDFLIEQYAFADELQKIGNAFADRNIDVIMTVLPTMTVYLKAGQWSDKVVLESNVLSAFIGLTSPEITRIDVRQASLTCLSFLASSEAVAAKLLESGILQVLPDLVVNRQLHPDVAVTEFLGVVVCEILMNGNCSDAFLASPFMDRVMAVFGEYLAIESVIPEICRDELVFMEIIYFLMEFLDDIRPELLQMYIVFFVSALNAKHHWLLRLISDVVSVMVEKWPRSLELVIKRGLLGFLASFLLVDTAEFWPYILKALRACLANANPESGQREVVLRFLRINEITSQIQIAPVGPAATAAIRLLADIIVFSSEKAAEIPVPQIIAILLGNIDSMSFDERSECLRFVLNVIYSRNRPGIEAAFNSGLINHLADLLSGCSTQNAITAAEVFLGFLSDIGQFPGEVYSTFFTSRLLPIATEWLESDDRELAAKAQLLSDAITVALP